MRRPVVVALLVLLLAPGVAAAAPFVDALLGVVEGRTVAASDIALARALGVLGFAPSTSPIAREDVERFVDVLLIVDAPDGPGPPEPFNVSVRQGGAPTGGVTVLVERGA